MWQEAGLSALLLVGGPGSGCCPGCMGWIFHTEELHFRLNGNPGAVVGEEGCLCVIAHQAMGSAPEVEIIFYWLGTVLYGEKMAAKTREFRQLSLAQNSMKNQIIFF